MKRSIAFPPPPSVSVHLVLSAFSSELEAQSDTLAYDQPEEGREREREMMSYHLPSDMYNDQRMQDTCTCSTITIVYLYMTL